MFVQCCCPYTWGLVLSRRLSCRIELRKEGVIRDFIGGPENRKLIIKQYGGRERRIGLGE
jgi:hypothetical protein